jgi:ADP-heptose:LPS heptosyltransferase
VALRLVVLRALGLGDLLTGVPALRALARAFPAHRRVLLAPDGLAPLVDLLDGVVHELHDVHGKHAVPHALPAAAAGADVAVDLHGRGPESTELLRATGPRRLIAFGDAVPWREGEHEVARWCRLLRGHGIAAHPSDLDLRRPAGPFPAPGATVIHPGAGAVARCWPVERWAQVARACPRVVVSAGPGEEELARAVARASGAEVFAGDLRDLARLVAGAARVVSSDTGVAHLATALRTPSVVLFGPTDPAEWGPPRERPRHRVLWAGRRGDPNAAQPHPGLLAIEPDHVLAELREAV